MLKISAIQMAGGLITLRLDGQVAQRSVKLLQKMCEAYLKKGTSVIIDLKHVSFVDRDGIELLRNLSDRQVEILNALPFIAEQLRSAAP